MIGENISFDRFWCNLTLETQVFNFQEIRLQLSRYAAEDCRFQMLNDAKIVTSMQEESNPVDYETDEDEDNNNNESSKGPSNADAFFVLETAMEWYEKQSECYPTYLLLLKRIRDLAAKKRRRRMVQQKISDYFPQ
ncbi:UNVERIFIED_CONTAM: hypothetical protein NCL1_21376 [Trichonephila clavipes]